VYKYKREDRQEVIGRTVMKCSKCITYYQFEKQRLELMRDVKAKSESILHASLKNQVCNMLRQIAKEGEHEASVDTEVSVKDIGKVDVVGQIGDVTIAVECGTTKPRKIIALEKNFDVVLHIPYCYTWELVKVDWNEVKRRIFAEMVSKGVERELGIKGETRRPICVEEGECSLPSGRDGYPIEAMQIAGLTTE
jgi:hypothetical protein